MTRSKDTQEKAKSIEEAPDFRIDRSGQWFHNGAPIGRKALAKLFSDRALKRDEDGRYWLQTPFEKYPVTVEDVPYVIVDFEDRDGVITLKTNMEETAELGPERPFELRDYEGQKLPYIEIRGGLYARLGRNVFYALVHTYGQSVRSNGQVFALGEME